ncbi:efflux RND transporter periplasmic adaptor subunit [Arenibacter latericius]|uniref:efflux RND transporter periplasmic adaptor subunit n=1 Tax=Arenibacter latericius TaxID=86104 RepID=UPI00047E8F89|nr:efflux RND transporter periplasmic adaptor subunit [Arenibacter latericius]MDX1364350.1 efflux RND transporter periplasmic adaptor subunit [Arenibacter latericius]
MKNTSLIPSTILSSILGLLLSSCADTVPPPKHSEIDPYCLNDNFKSKIAITAPTLKMVAEDIHLTGAVEPNPDKIVNFMSLVDGIISKTYFSLGDEVKKGQVLAEMRSADLADLYSQSQSINAQIRVAEETLKATQSMYDDGISSKKNLLSVQSELAILKAEKEKINANLRLFSASPEKGVFKIKAPHSGIITSKAIATGSSISAGGETLFTISDLSDVWVNVNIYASNVQDISTGMPVSIKTLSYPDETFEGTIAAISQVLDEEAKVLKARMVLPNPDLKLKPGMLVDVFALKERNEEALSIPTDTMVFDNNQNYVIVYNDDCDIEIRKVAILTKGNGTTFIADGLEESDKIISKNQLLIHEQIKNFQN